MAEIGPQSLSGWHSRLFAAGEADIVVSIVARWGAAETRRLVERIVAELWATGGAAQSESRVAEAVAALSATDEADCDDSHSRAFFVMRALAIVAYAIEASADSPRAAAALRDLDHETRNLAADLGVGPERVVHSAADAEAHYRRAALLRLSQASEGERASVARDIRQDAYAGRVVYESLLPLVAKRQGWA